MSDIELSNTTEELIDEEHIFLGRKEILDKLKQEIFVEKPGYHRFFALTGPCEIGKTWIASKLIEEKKEIENVFCVSTDLKLIETIDSVEDPFWWFWIHMLEKFAEQVGIDVLKERCANKNPDAEKIISEIREIYDRYQKSENYSNLKLENKKDISALFERYTKLGIQIVWIIDEFCRIAEIYSEAEEKSKEAASQIFESLVVLSPKAQKNKYNLNILLLGRRSLNSFHYRERPVADLSMAFDKQLLSGFTNDELEEYFEIYADGRYTYNLGRLLTDIEKQDIIYYCGRHPGLLMKMHKTICSCKRKIDVKGVKYIFNKQRSNFRAIYDYLHKNMKKQPVSVNEVKNCIGTYMQLFVVPPYESTLEAQLENLCDYGFLSHAETDELSIYELAGINQEIQETEETVKWGEYNGKRYESIAPYFTHYLESNEKTPTEIELYSYMYDTERTVRDLIRRIYEKRYPKNIWKNVLYSCLSDAHIKSYKSLIRQIGLNNAGEKECEHSPLQVLAYTDYAKIICANWDEYRDVFAFYKNQENLVKVFTTILINTRNGVAHLNQEIFHDEFRKEFKVACNEIAENSGVARKKCEEKEQQQEPEYKMIFVDGENKILGKKQYMYNPLIKTNDGVEWIEGDVLHLVENIEKKSFEDDLNVKQAFLEATPPQKENRYAIKSVEMYKARITDQNDISQLENNLPKEILIYVNNWNENESYFEVSLKKTHA